VSRPNNWTLSVVLVVKSDKTRLVLLTEEPGRRIRTGVSSLKHCEIDPMKPLTLPTGVRLIQPPARPFLVLETRTTLILDWDIQTEVSAEAVELTEPELTEATNFASGCCTISCTQDAVRLLEAYSDLCRDQLWAVYETGNGVRALRVDKDFPTDHVSLDALMLALDPDHKYMASSIERKHWAARVSHKEGRPEEHIRFLQWVGTGAAISGQ
jgi:hypothetical protein